MRAKELIGKMAVRIYRATDVEIPTLQLRLYDPFSSFGKKKYDSYMKEPVKIVAVAGESIVIEDVDGERKILDWYYDDSNWMEYEKVLHPEIDEQEKTEKLLRELTKVAEPVREFLRKNYDMMCEATIKVDDVQVLRGELGMPNDEPRY